jgi:Rrf2 family protein
MRISAKADYAVRAVVELAATDDEKPVKAERIAIAQEIPLNFLENILGDLRHAGIVRSHRGAEGGFRLAKPAEEITIADVIREVEGPLASVRGDLLPGRVGGAPAGVDRGAREPAQSARARYGRRRSERQASGRHRSASRGPGGLGHAVSGCCRL